LGSYETDVGVNTCTLSIDHVSMLDRVVWNQCCGHVWTLIRDGVFEDCPWSRKVLALTLASRLWLCSQL